MLYNIGGTLPPRVLSDTLPVAWVFPHFAFKGGSSSVATLYGGARVTDTLCWGRRLGFPTPIFALRALLLCVFETL